MLLFNQNHKFLLHLEKVFLILFLLFLPFQLGKHFWPGSSFLWGLKIDYLSPTIYLTDTLLLLTLALKIINSKNIFLKTKKKIPVLVYFLGGIFLLTNFLLCLNKIAFIIKFIKFLEIFALISLIKAEKNFIVKTVPAFFIPVWSIVQAVATWTQTIRQGSVGGLFWFLGERTFSISTPGIAKTQVLDHLILRPYGTFSHPNSLAGFLLVCIIIQTCLARNGLVRKNVLFWASLFSGLMTLFLTLSKTAIFVLLGYFCFVLIRKFMESSRSKRGKILVFSLLLMVLTVYYLKTVGLLKIDFSDSSIKNRVFLAKTAENMILSSPLFGIGLNNFISRLPEFWPKEKISLLWLQPVHNIYLLLASELGALGIFLILYFIKKLIFFKKSSPYFKIAILAIFVTGLFDHYWLTLQQNLLLLGIVLGLM